MRPFRFVLISFDVYTKSELPSVVMKQNAIHCGRTYFKISKKTMILFNSFVWYRHVWSIKAFLWNLLLEIVVLKAKPSVVSIKLFRIKCNRLDNNWNCLGIIQWFSECENKYTKKRQKYWILIVYWSPHIDHVCANTHCIIISKKKVSFFLLHIRPQPRWENKWKHPTKNRKTIFHFRANEMKCGIVSVIIKHNIPIYLCHIVLKLLFIWTQQANPTDLWEHFATHVFKWKNTRNIEHCCVQTYFFFSFSKKTSAALFSLAILLASDECERNSFCCRSPADPDNSSPTKKL